MTEPVPAPSTFNLLQLPRDVQLLILLAFNIRELIICKRMCRSLTELINNDVYIQTKIELARSGQIDGTHAAAVTVADRLASLRERRARFHACDHPLKRVRGRPFGSLGGLSYNGFLTMISEGMVHLWRPPAAFSGIGEQKIARSVRELQLEGFNTSSCAIDVAQDLLVVSRKDPAAMTLDCFIYSLSKGRPHPNASQSRISLSLASEGWQSDYWDSILILGDLIAWNVHNLHGRRCQMRVINWKTSIVAWEFHHDLWSRCRLISQSHVVVVTFESLLVYPIDLHLKTSSAHSTPHTALCILQLPAWSSISASRSLLVESYIQFPPPLGPDDHPLYCHDPELTLLTLEIHYIVDVPDHASEFVQYAMFIPISTIKARVALASPPHFPPPPPPRSPQSPFPPPSTDERGKAHAAAILVPWADWGPAGTRLVHLASEGPCRFSPMGGSCAVTHRRRDPSGGDLLLRVLVFDVHTWARPDAYQEGEGEGEWRRSLQVTEEGTRAGRAFTESLRTRFPFDVTRRDVPLAEDERYPTVVLAEDGLLLVISPG